jgi:hypothetical protein
MWIAQVALFAATLSRISPSPDIVPSDEVREDLAAGKKAEAQRAAEEAREERARRLRYDRDHMRAHRAVLALIRKARARYDRVRSARTLDATAEAVRDIVAKARQEVQQIDRWRNSSMVLADYDALLALFDEQYPAAGAASLRGEPRAIADLRAQFDGRMKKIRDWLSEAARQGNDED